MLGGGKENIFYFNHFENSDLGIAFDNRGMNWENSLCSEEGEF